MDSFLDDDHDNDDDRKYDQNNNQQVYGDPFDPPSHPLDLNSGPTFTSSASGGPPSSKRASTGKHRSFPSIGGYERDRGDYLTKDAAQPAGFGDTKPIDHRDEDDLDDLDQIDSLSWDYAAGALPISSDEHGRFGAHQRSRFAGLGRGTPGNIANKLRTIDWTFGLGHGTIDDLKSSLSFKKGREALGEPRTIYLNDEAMNGYGRGAVKGSDNQGKKKWSKNSVSTSKYNVVTFVPKFLIGEFESSQVDFVLIVCVRAVSSCFMMAVLTRFVRRASCPSIPLSLCS